MSARKVGRCVAFSLYRAKMKRRLVTDMLIALLGICSKEELEEEEEEVVEELPSGTSMLTRPKLYIHVV